MEPARTPVTYIHHLALAEKEIREYLSDLEFTGNDEWRVQGIKRKLKEALQLVAEAKFLRDQMELS